MAAFGTVGALVPPPVTGVASAASTAVCRATGTAARLPGQAASIAAAAADVGSRRRRRRVWSRAGRAHIEIRGLTGRGAAHRKLAGDVATRLGALNGVHRAEVNATTAQVLVSFDEDTVDAASLVEAIEAVEHAHGTHAQTFAWSAPPHPADDAPLISAVIALGADVVGIAVAASGKFLPLPQVPRAIRAPIVIIEAQPRLRQAVLDRLGPLGGDLALALGNAIAHGLSQGTAPLAVDAVARLIQIGELRSRQAGWARQETALHSTGHALPSESHPRRPRPAPLPAGPVETAGLRTSVAALAGAGAVLAWTGDPGEAATAILATAPRAAHLGREAFAGVLGMELARHGVVPLDGSALRRLDRVTAIVIDSAVLCAPRARILSADAAANADPAAGAPAWQAAEHILAGRALSGFSGPGPWARGGWRLARAAGAAAHAAGSARLRAGIAGPAGLPLDLFDERGRHRGSFLIGCELDFRAEALLGAARACAEQVILTEHASTTELTPWADEVLAASRSLAGQIRRLQRQGHGVLLVSAGHAEALDAADVGVGVTTAAHGVCWAADLVCGPGLLEAWRVLRAAGAAHRASQRAARFSGGGAAPGGPRRAPRGGPPRSTVRLAPGHGAGPPPPAARRARPPAARPAGDLVACGVAAIGFLSTDGTCPLPH